MSDSLLTIISTGGEAELLAKFDSFEMSEELNGGLQLSFSSFADPNNPGYDLIEEEGFVEYDGYEFRIKQLRTSPLSKQVTAISTYFDNSNNRRYDTYGGTHTFNEFATFVLQNTGWSFINEDISGSMFIPDFGLDNVVKLINTLKEVFVCEMKIEPGKVLRFAKQIGPDNDEQYRYRYNIISISESIDTTQLKTYIEGFGANGLHVSYTSPLATSPGIGIRHAEPITDDNFFDEASLVAHLKANLHDYPDSTVELDAIELQDKQIGERVWLIHERLGIEYQTRIMVKKTKIPRSLSTVVLGNVVPKTLSGILTAQKIEIDNNKKEYRSKIEQTNERISLEVSTLSGDIEVAQSSIQINADNIALKVSQTDYNGQTIASLINLSPSSVKIQGKNINLVGAVTVLSDITGDLGTLTAGTIDANKVNIQNLVVGGNVSMGPNATISWGNVTNQPTIIDSNTVTYISRNEISTASIRANQITGGQLTAINELQIGDINNLNKKITMYTSILGGSGKVELIAGEDSYGTPKLTINAVTMDVNGTDDGLRLNGQPVATKYWVENQANIRARFA